jgi:molecular chaperone GrpE (heat shock protein)
MKSGITLSQFNKIKKTMLQNRKKKMPSKKRKRRLPLVDWFTNRTSTATTESVLPLLQQLAKDFETKFKYDASKQEQIDKLYKENMDYKQNILKKYQQSLILAVIEKIDDAEKSIAFFADKEFSEENYRKLLAFYRDTTGDFQNALQERFDVSVFRCEPDTPFDVKRQKILKTVPTDNPTKHKTIKQTLRPGYEIDGQVLRTEMVEVYVKQ